MPDLSRRHVHRARSVLHSDKGYTLVEIAMAVMIAGVVLAGGYATYAFASNRVAAWQSRIALENAAHLTLRYMVADIRAADRIQVGANELRVIRIADPRARDVSGAGEPRTSHYMLSHDVPNRLLRNGTPLHDGSVSTLHFSARPRSPERDENRKTDLQRPVDGAISAHSGTVQRGDTPRPDTKDAFGCMGNGERIGASRRMPENEGHGTVADSRPLYDVQIRLATQRDTILICTSVRPRSPEKWPDLLPDGVADE